MSYRTILSGLALSLLVVQACGSDSGKHTAPGDEGGAGGEPAAAGGPSKGGSENFAGTPAGGEPSTVGPMGGAGGTPEPVTVGGESGGPSLPIPPDPQLLFTVKAGGTGLDDTGVHAQQVAGNTQNAIYSSKSGSQDRVDGTNEVVVTGTSLGLDAADKILSFTQLQPEPQDPVYLFSVADGSEGAYGTRIYNEYWTSFDQQGDVYFSDATTSFRYLGEGGDEFGYNALLATEASLGLLGQFDNTPDDLGGMLARDANQPLSELYFTVSSDSVGAVDGGIAGVDATERGCTIFKSELDGKSSVAFTCAQLGLAPGDELDGLLVFGTTAPSKIVFSVSRDSQGAVNSAVATAVGVEEALGAVLFQSTGQGTNTLLLHASDLGLGGVVDDELDGLTVIDRAPPPAVQAGASCDITYDLFAAGQGGLTFVAGVTPVGSNVLVALGRTGTGDRAIAYDATSCAKLQEVDLPLNFIEASNIAIAPDAGWSAATPLTKVHYLSIGQNQDNTEATLEVFDAAGAPLKAYGLGVDFPVGPALYGLLHDALNDRLFIITGGNHAYNHQLWQTAMPGAQSTSLSPTGRELAMPCGTDSSVRGLDAQGHVYLAERQGTSSTWESYSVCTYSASGELLAAPYTWANHSITEQQGFIVGGGAHVLLDTNNGSGPSAIQRDIYPSP